MSIPTVKEFTTDPESVGVSARQLGHIDQAMERAIERKALKGIVTLVARHGRIVQFRAYGEADQGVPMSTDAIFRLASMSKTIGAVAMLQLAEQGRLSLTDPVADYIPAFADLEVLQPGPDGRPATQPLDRPVTIHDLLTMTAGTARVGAAGRPGAELYSDGLRAKGVCDTMHPLDETLEEIVAKVATVPLAAQPGTRFEYSNVAVLTAGRIIELVSGQRLADYLQENILDPLRMVDTAFFQPPQKWSRVPAVFETGSLRRLDQLDVPGTDSTQVPFSPVQRFDNIAGGLSGSAYDYFRFAQMLLGGGQLDGVRIVSPNSVKLLSTNLVGDLRDNFFSHAWGYLASVQVDYNAIYNYLGLGSYGWHGYWGTVYRIWPEKDALVIFLTQGSPEPVAAWPTQRAFFSIVPAALLD